MASTFNSFNQSPLGGFIQSPLGARGVASIVGKRVLFWDFRGSGLYANGARYDSRNTWSGDLMDYSLIMLGASSETPIWWPRLDEFQGRIVASYNTYNSGGSFGIYGDFLPNWKWLSATFGMGIDRSSFMLAGYPIVSSSPLTAGIELPPNYYTWGRKITGGTPLVTCADTYNFPVQQGDLRDHLQTFPPGTDLEPFITHEPVPIMAEYSSGGISWVLMYAVLFAVGGANMTRQAKAFYDTPVG